jgi:hypothetical protein
MLVDLKLLQDCGQTWREKEIEGTSSNIVHQKIYTGEAEEERRQANWMA